jgi:hypothetical protein
MSAKIFAMNSIHSRYPAIPLSPELILVALGSDKPRTSLDGNVLADHFAQLGRRGSASHVIFCFT